MPGQACPSSSSELLVTEEGNAGYQRCSSEQIFLVEVFFTKMLFITIKGQPGRREMLTDTETHVLSGRGPATT